MAILIGIDEAGLGPVLGPLVVSAVAFEVPDEALDGSLWRALSPVVTRRPASDSERPSIAVADSKLLYHGLACGAGLDQLERGVLAFLACLGVRPMSLAELLVAVAPAMPAATVAWYRDDALTLPCTGCAELLERVACRLSRRLAAAGVRLLAIRSAPVLEAEFNRLLGICGNKSELVFAVTARLLADLGAAYPRERLVIHLDRQGGRKRYLPGLATVYPGAWIWITHEDDDTSRYLIEDGSRRIELDFTVGCEERQLPVALASMTSKYLRELYMAAFNRYWTARMPHLAPTAGYRPDGRRFFAEIAPLLGALGIEHSQIYRER